MIMNVFDLIQITLQHWEANSLRLFLHNYFYCVTIYQQKVVSFRTSLVLYLHFAHEVALASTQGKETFRFSSLTATCLPHTMEASHYPCNCWTSSKEAVNTNLYSLRLDPIRNQTQVYRFSSRCSINSTRANRAILRSNLIDRTEYSWISYL